MAFPCHSEALANSSFGNTNYSNYFSAICHLKSLSSRALGLAAQLGRLLRAAKNPEANASRGRILVAHQCFALRQISISSMRSS